MIKKEIEKFQTFDQVVRLPVLIVLGCWEGNSTEGMKCWRPCPRWGCRRVFLLTRSLHSSFTSFNKCNQRSFSHRAIPCHSVYTSKHITWPCYGCISVFPSSPGSHGQGIMQGTWAGHAQGSTVWCCIAGWKKQGTVNWPSDVLSLGSGKKNREMGF